MKKKSKEKKEPASKTFSGVQAERGSMGMERLASIRRRSSRQIIEYNSEKLPIIVRMAFCVGDA